MYDDRDLKLLIGGIVLIGVGWFLPGSPRLGGVVMLIGAVVMLVAQYRMFRWARRRRRQ